MKKSFSFLLVISLFFGCTSDDSGNNNGGDGGGIVAQAVYRVTFIPSFTEDTHPTDYPNNPVFKGMVLMAHDGSNDLYSVGQLASEGMKLYAEDGNSSTLVSENTVQNDGDGITVIMLGSDIGPSGTDSVDITVTPNTALLSFVSKLDPSPDWFVGIDSFNLINPDNTLVEETEITLFPFDAGTDAGTSYESENSPDSSFVESITVPPLGAENGISREIGILRIERIS